MNVFSAICRRAAFALALACAGMLHAAPVAAQVETIDPDIAIDGDLASPQDTQQQGSQPGLPEPLPTVSPSGAQGQTSELPPENSAGYPAAQPSTAQPATQPSAQPPVAAAGEGAAAPTAQSGTYKEDDLIGAAEGVFGKGAKGLAGIIEDILAKQGEPNGYIVGREGGGALFFGARYGSGTLYHKVEGTRPVYWTGPSLGLDIGANAANAFVLVYNLYDSQDLFHRYGQGEGQAYFIGGFHVSYLRRGDVVLIPVRMGAGLRLGVNVGYMNFSEKQRWLPF